MDIAPIARIGIPRQFESVQSLPELPSHSGAFATLLQQSLERVNGLQHEADTAARAFALGQAPSVHDTMIAMEKADLSLRGSSTINRGHEHHRSTRRLSIGEGRPRCLGGVQRGGGT